MTLKEYIKKHPYNSDGDNIIEFLRHDIKLRALVLSQLARDVSIDIQLLLYENESKQKQLDEQKGEYNGKKKVGN